MDLRTLLRSQDGVVSLAQTRRCGVSASALSRRVAAGELIRVHPGVYLSAAHPWSPRARVRAAALWAGPDATVVGEAAAWWWRLSSKPPATITVAVPPGAGGRGRGGVRRVRRTVSGTDRVVVDGVAVTSRPATVLDVAAVRGVLEGARLTDHALLGGAVSVPGLREVHERTRGRRGTSVADRVLALAEGGARSEAERVSHRLLRRGGIAGWRPNHPVRLPGGGIAVLDIAFPAARVAVEIDGWAYHRGLREFCTDARRQNALVLAGWTVLRFTWFDLQDHPERLVAAVERALASRPAM